MNVNVYAGRAGDGRGRERSGSDRSGNGGHRRRREAPAIGKNAAMGQGRQEPSESAIVIVNGDTAARRGARQYPSHRKRLSRHTVERRGHAATRIKPTNKPTNKQRRANSDNFSHFSRRWGEGGEKIAEGETNE